MKSKIILSFFMAALLSACDINVAKERWDSTFYVHGFPSGATGTAFQISETEAMTAGHVCEGNALFIVPEEGVALPIHMEFNDKTDLCLLDTSNMSKKRKAIPFADSFKLGEHTLEEVHILGYPMGLGKVYTKGQVIEHKIPDYPFTLSTAVAYPGNSGGPAMNSKGELVGVVVHTFPPTFFGGFIQVDNVIDFLERYAATQIAVKP